MLFSPLFIDAMDSEMDSTRRYQGCVLVRENPGLVNRVEFSILVCLTYKLFLEFI